MGEALVARYWCHLCAQTVSPVMEAEIKCPFCDGGFVEEIVGQEDMEDTVLGLDGAVSLSAPTLPGVMSRRSRRQSTRREEEEEEDSDEDHELRSLRGRRRSALLQFVQQVLEDLRSEYDEPESGRQRERDEESMVLINAFNQAFNLQGSFDADQTQSQGSDIDRAGASLGDYFVGPGFDMLLHHLAENDPNRHGTPPAKKEAVNALPNVKIEVNMACSVCLEEFDIGTEAREMPCKHKFHSGCILPWLELHSSCPVCRFQLPAEESRDANVSGNGSRVEGSGTDGVDSGGRGNGSRL